MKATETNKLAGELLELLAPMEIDGWEKVAALKSAAATLENILNAEATKQMLSATIATIFQRK